MAIHEVECWLMCDENGDYVIAKDAADLAEKYDGEIGGGPELNRRTVKVVVKVQVEQFVELTGTAPAEGAASLSVA